MSKFLQTSFKSALKYLACLVIAIQAVPAAVWIIKNITTFNEDFMAANYITAADTLVVDEYMGILYAVVVRLLGHGWILYLIQLAFVAFFAWFMGGIGCLGLVVTNPFVLHSCFSCLPNALILACIMAMVGIVKKYRKWTELLWIVIPEVALGLLNPDYVWLCLLIMTGIAVYKFWGRQRSGYVFLVATVFSLLVSLGINDAVTVSGSYGRGHRSVQFLMMQRLNWPDIQGDYVSLKLYQGVDLSAEGIEASRTAEKLSTVWAFEMDKKLGEEGADDYYTYMYESALNHGPRAVIMPIIKDEAEYFFAPAGCLFLTVSGEASPALAKEIYLFERGGYGLFSLWITFSLVVSSVFGIIGVIKQFKECKKNLVAFLWIALCCSLYATMICVRGFDYRNILVIMAGWPLLILSGKKVCEE